MVRRVGVDGAAGRRPCPAFPPVVLPGGGRAAADGLPGSVPARPGPRRAHKLTEEMVTSRCGGPGRGPVGALGRRGRGDRGDLWGPGASTVGGAGADAGEEPQQWRARMTAAPTTAAADVERYEQLRRRALAGDAPWPPGSPCCSSTAWRPGYAAGAPWAHPARRGLRRRDQPVPLRPRLTGWSSRRPRWRWARWQG